MLLKLAFTSYMLITFTGIANADEKYNPTLLGGALLAQPAYDGSRSTNVDPIPLIMYSGTPWFARTTEGILEGGVKTELFSNLDFGLQVAYEDGRNRHDSGFLKKHHVSNLDPTLSVGGFLQYENEVGIVPIDILARYRKGIETSRGDQVDLRITAGIYGGEDKRLNVAIFAQTTWANSKYMQSFYGITNNESVSTGLSAYNPGSGHLSNQIGFWASYDLTPHWILVGSAERHQLQGDAKNSPLTEQRYNNYFSLGIGYQF